MRAFNVMSERMTCSRQGPLYLQRPDHFFHHLSVSRSERVADFCSGSEWWDGYQTRSKNTLSPLATVKSATVVNPSPRSSTSVHRRSLSGPAVAVMPCESRVLDSGDCTQGTMEP